MAPFRKKHTYEAFLSHAIEDRAVIVEELYERLHSAGVKTWYSAKSLTTGIDLEDEIEKAIEDSRFGVVVLTKFSIDRPWPITEYNWLKKKEANGIKVILPVVHDMTMEELAVKRPGIAAKYYIHSSRGMDFVIDKILEDVINHRIHEKNASKTWWLSLASIAFALLLIASITTYLIINDRPPDSQITNTINDRIEKLNNETLKKYINPFKLESSLANQSKIDSAKFAYDNYKSYFRNEYEFNSGLSVVRSRKNVQAILSYDPADLVNTPGYGMKTVDIYWSTPTVYDSFRHSSFSLVNKSAISFSYDGHKNGDAYLVSVTYTEGIQYINVALTIPPSSTGTRRHEMTIVGLPPSETYSFEKAKDGEWHLTKIE